LILSIPFETPPESSLTTAISISDLEGPSTVKETGAHPFSGPTPNLHDVDDLFGPLRIGEMSVSRQQLHTLDARLNGQAITAATTYFSEPDQTFLDALEFDPAEVEQRIRSVNAQESHNVAALLYEIVTQRSPDAPSLMRKMIAGDSAPAMNKLGGLLQATQGLDIRRDPLPDHLPSWVDKAKSRSMTTMGVGLQAYGLYSAYIGAIDALKKGQTGEVLINVGGGLAEITSLGFEYALTKTGEQMIRQGSMAIEQFGKTSMGRWLCRGAGLIASALTLPFDIYTAIKSFNDAAKAQGKEAQDLYVNGGLSVFSAALSLALGCAALMGFKAAGPVGIAAAAIMIIGARIYGAVRAVDDIDDYIELTVNERWRAGWFAFTGQDQDKALMERYLIAKTTDDYNKALKTQSLRWLNNELRDNVDAIVNGRFEVKLQPVRLYRYQWNEAKGEVPYTSENLPVIIETNDHYDARAGLPASDAIITAVTNAPAKGVFWNLGAGDDDVQGVQDKPNFFSYGTGSKTLTGGDKDDSFLFHSASEALSCAPGPPHQLRGGDGTDLLWLQGTHKHQDPVANPPLYVGYDIDMNRGNLRLRSSDPASEPQLHSTFSSIEKVETLAGAANRVTGSDQADIITANGEDRVNAGAGDDQIAARGHFAIIDGGSGSDTYQLNPMSRHITITEDGMETSKVFLGVPLEAIQSWTIRDHALVIESLRDDHLQSPPRTLVLEAVYRTVDGKRVLNNDKWVFITQDGYHLQPAWPADIPDPNDHFLHIGVITAGVAKPSPVQLNSTVNMLSTKAHSQYFVSGQNYHTILKAAQNSKPSRSTLYVDFDSKDIAEVRAIYTVTARQTKAFTLLTYENVHFRMAFAQGGGLLSLHGAITEDPGRKGDRGAGILASGWKINHGFTLVMRDGISYELDYPRFDYPGDARNPGYRSIESRASLRERAGTYSFVKPSVEKRTLKASPQRVDFKAIEHNATYWLQGRSSTYELYPTSNISIRLSTAEADARTRGSSSWHIHTQQLQEEITYTHLAIKDDLLKIGSLHIHLPDSNAPSWLPESIEIVVTSGNRYRVHALFDVISLLSINAQSSPSIQAIANQAQDHKQRDALESDNVQIENIQLLDDPHARIFYNAASGLWTVDGDSLCPVNPEDLIIEKTPTGKPTPNWLFSIVKE
jgi:hypothetical protein